MFTVDTYSDISSTFVPTVDSLKKQYLITALDRCGKAVLLSGGPGTSKTAQFKNYLERNKSDMRVSKTINFSASTSAAMFQAS